MSRSFLNSGTTDVIKFTRAVTFDVDVETSITIAFLDQIWSVGIKSQKTRYWTFSVKVWLKSSSNDRTAVSIHGWLNDVDMDGNEQDDDWSDPSSRPHFKIMRKDYAVGCDSVDPVFVTPNQISRKAQVKLVFQLFDVDLRSVMLKEDTTIIDKLFSTKMYHDVIIEAMDGKVRAHKWILKLKSKYFEAMFNHELSDKNRESFKIEDISCVVLNEIFRFIYTRKVQDMEVLAHEILLWSDFFAIDELRELSSSYVVKSFNSENILTVLELAVNANQEDLKEQAINYFNKNIDQVVASKAWSSAYKDLPSSVQEIIKLLIKKHKNDL